MINSIAFVILPKLNPLYHPLFPNLIKNGWESSTSQPLLLKQFYHFRAWTDAFILRIMGRIEVRHILLHQILQLLLMFLRLP